MKTDHAKSIAGYRTATLEKILADYQARTRKDGWDVQRISAIRRELKRRREGMRV